MSRRCVVAAEKLDDALVSVARAAMEVVHISETTNDVKHTYEFKDLCEVVQEWRVATQEFLAAVAERDAVDVERIKRTRQQ
jgi:hypothetical protein